MRRRGDRLRQGQEGPTERTLKAMQKLDDDKLSDFGDLDELMDEDLREFLAADGLPCEADSKFRERLREKLWELVSRNARVSAVPSDEEPNRD